MKLAAALSLLAVPVDGRRSNPLLARHLQDELLAKELPDTGEEWSTLQNGVEFQPAGNLSPLAKEHLRRLTSSNTTADDEEDLDITDAYEKIFVDGAETRYDEYSQAWRALGFFVDCDYVDNGDDRRGRRSLQDGEGAGCQRFMLWAAYVDEEYSGNEVGEYMYYDRNNDKWDETACGYNQTNRCVKMDCHLPDTHFSLLGYFKEPNYDEWMNQLFKYEGDCVWTDEEYQFMQQSRDVWPTGCTESTHTILIHSYSSSLYYDIKPSEYGDYGIGLYTDNMCSMEYTGDITVDEVLRRMVCGYNGADGFADDLCSTGIDNWKKAWTAVNGNGYGDDDGARNLWSLVGQLEKWNSGFDVWKQCQPCKAYDLLNVVAGFKYEATANATRYDFVDYNMFDDDIYEDRTQQCTCIDSDDDGDNQEDGQCDDHDGQCEWTCFDQDGDQVDNDRRHLEDQGGNNQNGYDCCCCCQADYNVFHCNDAAGYDDVNQCMKFATHTKMMTASFNDMEIALAQGGIASISLENTGTGTKQAGSVRIFVSYIMLFVTSVLFGGALYRYIVIKGKSDNMKEPLLIPTLEGVVA